MPNTLPVDRLAPWNCPPPSRRLAPTATRAEVLAAVQHENPQADAISYYSRFVQHAPNNSLRRILVYLPNEIREGPNGTKFKYDRYINMTTPENPAAGLKERQLDMISVERETYANGTWKPLAKKHVHFEQFWREDNGLLVRRTKSSHPDSDKCITCHATGVRILSPRPGSLGVEQLPALKRFNDRLTQVGVVDRGTAFQPQFHGPAKGASYVGCAKCHNGGNDVNVPSIPIRGMLTDSFNIKMIEHKLLGDLSMPPISEHDLAGQSVLKAVRLIDQLPADQRNTVYSDMGAHGRLATDDQVIDALNGRGLLADHGISYPAVKAKLAQMLAELTMYLKRLQQVQAVDTANWFVDIACYDY